MIPKDAINRASLENLAAFKRASSFSNIPRPSSSSKKSKENENFIQLQQQQSQQNQQQPKYGMIGSAGNLHKQQVIVSQIPLSFNQNIQNSQGTLTQRGKESIINSNNGIISSSSVVNGLSQSQQKPSTTAPNSSQNTARNHSQNSTVVLSNSASKLTVSSNNIPNSARGSSQKQLTQTSSSSINNLSVINLSNISSSQIPISLSQQNIRLSTSSSGSIQQPIAPVNNIIQNGINISNTSCQQNPQYPQSTTKNLREILQSSTTKQNHLHGHKLQTHKQIADENQPAVTQKSYNLQQQNSNPSSKRVLTTPSTIGGSDDYGYKDLNFYKKEILRMSLSKQSSSNSASSSSQNNGYNNLLNQLNVNSKENSYNPGSTTHYKQRNSDQIDTYSNSLIQSQSIASSSLLSIGDKPLTAVKKSKKNAHFYQKEIEYYRQREVEYLQKIQKLEKENKRVTQIVQKSDQDISLLRGEIVEFSKRYNLQTSQQNFQDDKLSEIKQQKQRVVTPAFTSQQQCGKDGQISIMNIHLQDIQSNSDQPMHINELINNEEQIDEAEYIKNQEKINLLQSYSANLESKLKQLEYNIHSSNNQQTISNTKLTQNREVINNCYKVLEQKYIALYQKTKQSKHESDDIQTQILFYQEELKNDPSNRYQNNQLNELAISNPNQQLIQNSVLKALQIGKQVDYIDV